MKELAEKRRRFGCERLHLILKREGLVVNHKRTERIYQEERLTLRIRRRKKLASQGRIEISKAERPDELWAMDFMQDALYDGRRFRVLPIIDTYTKESLKIAVDTSIRGERVVEILNRIAALRGLPENIIVDNGPEFLDGSDPGTICRCRVASDLFQDAQHPLSSNSQLLDDGVDVQRVQHVQEKFF